MAATQTHPRRAPAHRSVSLLHGQHQRRSPLQDTDSSADSNSKKSGSPSSLQALGKISSGESSNADQWFNESNNEAGGNSGAFTDNDPPFFMRNNSSKSQTPPDVQQQQQQSRPAIGGDLPPRMALLGTDGSSTEDYRGVIDDLTIENKKLKKRLKKYETLHDAHLHDQKLFEVRFHGLPPDKKSELEETLQKFAASLGNNRFPTNAFDGLMPSLMDKNASPAPQTDSAYASNSASGAGSSSRSAVETRSGVSGGQTAALRRDNIHSYLHHIPEGLLPQTNPTNMPERTKQKLVVRRLEQIFAGKGAALHGHQHPQQQQEVSNMAARADKAEYPSQLSRQEGVREAHIMSEEGEKQVDLAETTAAKGHFSPPTDKENTSPEQAIARPEGEQRPTCPLDLDPHRAQVPADNMRYIRHLGFSPSTHSSPDISDEGRGWVYLNILINMAQLHTINVTTEFVRKAVATRSSNFEVSSDGRKVRWKGGSPITRESSMAGGSSTGHIGLDTPEGQSPNKRPKLSHRDSYRSQVSNTESKLLYTPMFCNRSSTDGTDYTSEDEETMLMSGQAPIAGDSSGMASSGMHTSATRTRKRQRDDGPVIFYQNARFCTDLSGDAGAQYNRNAPLYEPITETVVGEPQTNASGIIAERRGPLVQASELPVPMDLNDNPIPEAMEIAFPLPSVVAERKDEISPIDLEVSGIGGVWPTDNFAIMVESRHAKLDQAEKPQHTRRQYLSTRLSKLWPSSAAAPPSLPSISKQIVKSSRKDLPPSELPPALGFLSQSEDYDSDNDDDDVSASPVSDRDSVPEAIPQPVQVHPWWDEDEDEYDDDMDDDESDGSVDMLATAREMDPEAIRLREREYDANMAERLAEEIPAGSSAATAGGGSGFGSPAHGMSNEEYQQAMAEHRARRGVMRRSTTADSMKVLVQGARATSSDGEDEEMADAVSVTS